MWKFSTYLANVVGSLFTKLPLGETMIGLNIYTGLIKAFTSIIIYYICVYEFDMKSCLVFLSQLMALGYCWCPTALLYNYCTYLLFDLGAILICIAAKRNKFRYYLIAGICLGLNVMVRLPNLAEIALIFAVWYYSFVTKDNFIVFLKKTGLCILGYLVGIASVLGFIFAKYGVEDYIIGIKQILSMSSHAGGYSLKHMIRGDFESYIYNCRWLVLAIGVIVFGVVLYSVFKTKFTVLKRIIYCLCNVILIYVYWKIHMFGFIYHRYDSIYYVGIFFLIISGLLGLYVIFFWQGDKILKLYGFVMGIVILITPLGSNNYLFSAVNNLFIVTPFVFTILYKFIVDSKNKPSKIQFIFEPVKITLLVLVAFMFIQGLLFGVCFVFRDGIDGQKRDTKIENIPILKGMYTTEKNAENLNEIYDFLNEEQLTGEEAIFFYNVPGLAYYMEIIPAMSSAWPDLDSFSTEKFQTELELIKQNASTVDKPLLILGCSLEEESPKLEILREYTKDLDYELIFSNEICNIYY